MVHLCAFRKAHYEVCGKYMGTAMHQEGRQGIYMKTVTQCMWYNFKTQIVPEISIKV